MNVIFIDCGAYKGKALNWARVKYPGAKLYAFECNPHLSLVDYGKDVTTIRKAVWKDDGKLNFYMNTKHPLIEGHSVYDTKTTGDLDSQHPVEVECIDFSKFLYEAVPQDEYVIIKMNVEGAEYDVLEHCIENGSINLVDQLHVQWHFNKIPGMTKRHLRLQKQLSCVKALEVINGYGILKS